jgi:hypothetical protein
VRDGVLRKYWSKAKIEKIRLVAAAVLTAVAFLFLLIQIRPFLVTLSRAGNDLGAFLFTGEAQLDFGDIDFSQSDLMIFVAPLFLVSVLIIMRQRREETKLLLLWGAFLFLYYEWGTIGPNPLNYTPLQAFSEARYLLFALAPLVILAGIYLAKGLTDRQTRWSVPAIALLTLALAIVEKETLYAGGWKSWTAAGTFLLVTGSIVSPVFVSDKNLKIRNAFTILLLFVLSLSLLQPFLPYHALMYQDRLNQLDALRMSMPFWNEHKDYPICVAEAMSLNYASNFQLGFDWQGLRLPGSSPKIMGSLPEGGSCYLVTTLEPSTVPENWWLVADFASGQQTVNIYRVLNELDAGRELSSARENLDQERTIENLERFYGASVNAGSWMEVFPAWIELHQIESADYTLDHLEHLITAYLDLEKPALGGNLFRNSDFAQGLTGWVYPDPERVTLRADGYVAIRVGGKMVGLSQAVSLEPSTIYIFTMKIATDVGMDVDLLGIDRGRVADSSLYPISSDNPADVLAVFVTPDWDTPEHVRVDLFVPLEAGLVRLREPAIYEIAGLAQ